MKTLNENLAIIEAYNIAWEEGRIKTPLVILIGGYAGTGKSTLALLICNYLRYMNVLPTGVIRSILKVTDQRNPYLNYHTYDFHKLTPTLDPVIIEEAYKTQYTPVAGAIQKIIEFAASEKQHYIIDGNHVFPSNDYTVSDECILIEFYLKVSDENTHRNMIGGPTHNRELNEVQFRTGRILQDSIIQAAAQYRKEIFESTDCFAEIVELIANRIAEKEPTIHHNSSISVVSSG
jgi:2-phosphoglycerate kinase